MNSTAPLSLTEALNAAEEAAVGIAFVNVVRHTASDLGNEPGRSELESWTREQRESVASSAQRGAREASTAETLCQWLSVRPFDDDVRCQRLTMRLERVLVSRLPDLFTSAETWLRRGYAPQIAFLHALAQSERGSVEELVGWVESERATLVRLMQQTGESHEHRAAEAFYELRARHDFHFRILMGITSEHDVTRLEDDDALLAGMVGAVWTGLEFEKQGLAQLLVSFARHHGSKDPLISSVTAATESVRAQADATPSTTGEQS